MRFSWSRTPSIGQGGNGKEKKDTAIKLPDSRRQLQKFTDN